jgi:hypothetical protein
VEEKMARKCYKYYSLTATSDVGELIPTWNGEPRASESVQIKNIGDVSIKIVLITPLEREVDFSTENKVIELSPGDLLEDELEVEKVLYKADSGTGTLSVYVSF